MGGIQQIAGGTVIGTEIDSGGVQTDYAASVTSTTINSGGLQILSGGTVYDTVVNNGGWQRITGGTAYGTLVSSGGSQSVVFGYGTAVGTMIESGALQIILDASVSDTTVEAGGKQVVSSGGIAVATQLDSGGEEVIAGGTVVVAGGADAFGTIVFVAGSGGLLTIADPAAFSATVSGFSAGDTIDLTGLAYTDTGSAAVSGNFLVVTEGRATQAISVDPSALASTTFLEASDGAAGTNVTLTPPCFAAGTRIATERGPVKVEALVPGDILHLASGGTAPVIWVGHRRVQPRRHPSPDDVQPVRIAAHAFGLGRPSVDLLLSPDHAVFVDGVLIPVRYLLNGATVRQEDAVEVTCWHVELSKHNALLAEGLACESFLDTGNRAAFSNQGGIIEAHPAFARAVWERAGFAPLITEGPIRDLVYRRLLAQAFSLGWLTRAAGGEAVRWLSPRPHRNMWRQGRANRE